MSKVGPKFRFHDNHEFFHPACSVESRRQSPVQGQSVSRLQRQMPTPEPPPPHQDAHRRHCTAGEIASELGYSVSYILAVKKAMYAHPAFRMRDVYECHPKALPERKESESH